MEEHTDNRTEKVKRWMRIVKRTGKCPLCPPHGGENATRYSRPRKPKNKNRKR